LPLHHCWVFNAQLLDFILAEIKYLEETIGPTVTLHVGGHEVCVPGSWNILVLDKETYSVDTIPVASCSAFEHDALIFSPQSAKPITLPVRAIKLEPEGSCIYPSVSKAQALVHTISSGISHGKEIVQGIILSPNDLWRWIGGKTIGDILG
jgi:hypothetical protein